MAEKFAVVPAPIEVVAARPVATRVSTAVAEVKLAVVAVIVEAVAKPVAVAATVAVAMAIAAAEVVTAAEVIAVAAEVAAATNFLTTSRAFS